MVILLLIFSFRSISAFPTNLFSDSDLELFRPTLAGEQYIVRWNEQRKLLWIEHELSNKQFLFCDHNSTITTSIRSPSTTQKPRDPRYNYPTKLCLFDGFCDVDYPQFTIITFRKIEKQESDKKIYQFESEYSYYLDIDVTSPAHSDRHFNGKQIMQEKVRLCKWDDSEQQEFQSASISKQNKAEL
uniref:Uncharacterized protein n=1 Tax=Elphidium margaritaceum TaxID=933848 RepID=A0A7S0XMR4_9EUKA|eukprot:CAMPEP_0202713086 /NCGR_PEP_ID=MMETSP1385-20130828/49594_1 /ASSEMBLY_ACC=CAM_ASM_000861 /TAXON_ID=933848 /ORGANISM="Elphidium margaritaceum" /LENGTH=185 /DNA_ID=CAMNT_0049373333 /DNA_START=69 /DNA_END=626 /DNA_ORIENTATION=-